MTTKSLSLLASVGFICLAISGCGIVAKINARDDMSQSRKAYKSCLLQHSKDVSACEGAKLAYDADMKAYRATSAGVMPGFNNSLNINTSNE